MYILQLFCTLIIIIVIRRRRAVYYGRPAQGPIERVLRSTGEGAEKEGHSDSAPGRQVQHDHCAIARVLHETK